MTHDEVFGLTAAQLATINHYVDYGIAPGGFMTACIENDLKNAVARADDESLPAIPAIVRYLYNECPSGCWGFAGAVKQWQESLRRKNIKESYETTDHGDSVWPR